VAVGTFTGSRIGSQTIYSGAGVLLPMGLYDARKRALAKAATEKQAAVDKYFDVIDTAPQYQEKFNTDTFDFMNNKLNQYKGNYDAFLKDPEVRREYARRKGLAKELTHYSKWADDLLKDASEEKKYVTKEMVDVSGEIKSALINNADDVVSGKKDLGPLFA
jgi:ATPase subunit of ABC transporter with duplicated ATPase domains